MMAYLCMGNSRLCGAQLLVDAVKSNYLSDTENAPVQVRGFVHSATACPFV